LGFFDLEARGESIRIESQFLGTALSGDIVRVRILSEKQGEILGEVEEIIIRKKMEFVGTVKEQTGICIVSPQDARVYRDIIIPDAQKAGARPNPDAKSISIVSQSRGPQSLGQLS